jgi:ribonuclease BN (tRNA processing enzyme)
MSTTRLAGLVLAGLAWLFAAGAEAGTPASAKSGAGSALGWITLGTQGGPISNGERSEPANLLVVNGTPWIVDCGDGAMDRLGGAGFAPSQIDVAFISHLHIDHIGGLLALIGIRAFTGARNVLTIYGPPGTDVLVAGILQSLAPTARIQLVPGPTLEQLTHVVIVKDGSDLNVNGVRIRAVRNSHFDTSPGHPADNGSQSLSYRFDYGHYSIGYTGDTGPSDAVTRLEKGVDLLVSEVIDLRAMDASIRQAPDVAMPPGAKEAIIEHFQTQHLTPQAAGTIAARAGAQRLVLTHLSVVGTTDANAAKLVSQAHETFHGQVTVARDLDRF